MSDNDLEQVISFIENYYSTLLTDDQIILIKEELEGYTFTEFLKRIKKPLLKEVNYFTVAGLHRIVEDDKRAKRWLDQFTGIDTWEDLYANNK